jgi:O-antigen/teichoic acid export membrane protein
MLVTLITCRECGGTMPDTAGACPHCGAPAGRAGRSHGIVGKLYVGLCYFAAAMFALSALLMLVMPLASEPRIRDTAEPGLLLVSFGGIVVVLIACARGVRRFRGWGWWLATIVSALAVLSCLGVMVMPTDADAASVRTGALFVIAIHAVFLLYFWSRRRDFGMGR